jgi:hypothetical protein
MKTQIHTQNKSANISLIAVCAGFFLTIAIAHADDPRTNSWFTTYSGQYARIYTTDLNRTNGNSVTTWSSALTTQSLPAYCGVQEVYSSSNYVYVRSTGLAAYVMGAWYAISNHTVFLMQDPTNQKTMFRIPRTTSVPMKKTLSNGGAVGMFVDGVAMYNNWDANFWNGTTEISSGGTNGFWNRDAYVNECVSFDPGNAHQPPFGQYHYHANPPGLRYQLGDHVDLNPVTKIYTESTSTPTKHSPILGWAADGFPIYGPYGYSVSNDASSGIRRMISGFVIRDGNYGTSNLTANGRTTIPQWAVRLYGVASNVLAGPPVNSNYPLGRYMEDNDYLGDHGYVQGKDFDLDEYNCRYCVTPEFPGGTYAYFVAISSNGTPVYPYNIGFGYYGNPSGGTVSVITETVVTNFLGYTNLVQTLNSPTVKSGTVTLSWSALEGGSYQVDATTNLADSSAWTVLQSGLSPNQITGGYTNVTSLDKIFYRVDRNSVANFDNAGTNIFAVAASAPGGSASRGQTIYLTITLPTNPPLPPINALPASVAISGVITNTTNFSRTATNIVQALLMIPSLAATGTNNVVVTFSPAPTYTLTNGFTIN